MPLRGGGGGGRREEGQRRNIQMKGGNEGGIFSLLVRYFKKLSSESETLLLYNESLPELLIQRDTQVQVSTKFRFCFLSVICGNARQLEN